MSTFRGGPADGVTLMFQRGPIFLRVVVDRSEEEETGHPAFDVLDMPGDEPRDGEEVHVYRRIGQSRPAHLNYRGTKGGRSGWYEFADYEHVLVDDETRAAVRDTAAWREWAMSQGTCPCGGSFENGSCPECGRPSACTFPDCVCDPEEGCKA